VGIAWSLCAWFGGWVFGELSASGELLGGRNRTPVAFLSFWLIGWTIGGIFERWVVMRCARGKTVLAHGQKSIDHRGDLEARGGDEVALVTRAPETSFCGFVFA
jgi:hypothetical protein